MTQEIVKFEVGKTYATPSIGDHNCIYSIKIISRTEKTAQIVGFREKRCKIYVYNGEECIKPERYSFAPVFGAKDEVA